MQGGQRGVSLGDVRDGAKRLMGPSEVQYQGKGVGLGAEDMGSLSPCVRQIRQELFQEGTKHLLWTNMASRYGGRVNLEARPVSLWRSRQFLPLVIGQGISRIGDGVFWAGMMWLTYQYSGSVLAASGLVASYYLPASLFGLIGGAVADRFNRRRVLIVADLLRGCVLLLISALTLRVFNLPLLYLTSCILAAAAKFFDPALKAMLPQQVARSQLTAANSMLGLCLQVSSIAGPVLGGLLVGRWGGPAVLALDRVSFLIGAALTCVITYPAGSRQQGRVFLQTVWRDIGAGLGFVVTSRLILGVALSAALINFFLGPMNVLMPRYSNELLGVDAAHYGLLGGMLAAGSRVGSLFVPLLRRALSPLPLVFGGLGILGFLVVGMASVRQFEVALVLLFIGGWAVMVSQIPATVMLQEQVPDAQRGRTFGALEFMGNILFSCSVIAAGKVVDQISLSAVFVGMGIAIVASSIGCWAVARSRAAPVTPTASPGSA